MQSLLWPEIPDLFTSNFGVAAYCLRHGGSAPRIWAVGVAGAMIEAHHQPLKMWILCLYFMGLHISNDQIAHELNVDRSDVHQMTTALREGIVKKAHSDIVKRGGVRRSVCDCRGARVAADCSCNSCQRCGPACWVPTSPVRDVVARRAPPRITFLYESGPCTSGTSPSPAP